MRGNEYLSVGIGMGSEMIIYMYQNVWSKSTVLRLLEWLCVCAVKKGIHF